VVDSLPSFINRFPAKQFGKNTSDRPYIDGSRLVKNSDFVVDVEN